jgi:hypothetical protein
MPTIARPAVVSAGAGERLAALLTAQFLEGGNFTAGMAIHGVDASGLLPAATGQGREVLEFRAAFSVQGYGGLSVQAVGHEEGSGEERVHIYVAKGSRKAVAEINVNSSAVAVEINRVGKLIVRPDQASSATHRGNLYLRRNRVACGSSCAPSAETYAGTFGALIRKSSGEKLYVLSNNHVLAACNHTPVGMPILAPSSMDAGPNIRAPGEIARHSEICELRSGVPALVDPGREDAAIAAVGNLQAVSSWQGDSTHGYDTPTHIVAPTSGQRVKKFGRTTGLTLGTVEARVGSLMPLPYKTRQFSATVWFRDVWSVLGDSGEPFALGGDSGSLVVSEDGRSAVGLVFAVASGNYAFIIPMEHIATCFGGIQLVGGHGV